MSTKAPHPWSIAVSKTKDFLQSLISSLWYLFIYAKDEGDIVFLFALQSIREICKDAKILPYFFFGNFVSTKWEFLSGFKRINKKDEIGLIPIYVKVCHSVGNSKQN